MWLGVVTCIGGCISVYMVINHPHTSKPSAEPTQTTFTQSADPTLPHALFPKKVSPSVTAASPSAKPSTAKPSTRPSTAKSHPAQTVAPQTPVATPTASPSPRSTPSQRPTPTPTTIPTPTQTGLTWTTSPTAVQAAQRMEAGGYVGDPVCSAAGTGTINASIPPGTTTVYTGQSGNYWCLIFVR